MTDLIFSEKILKNLNAIIDSKDTIKLICKNGHIMSLRKKDKYTLYVKFKSIGWTYTSYNKDLIFNKILKISNS